MENFNRVQWACRRGMLELDLLLLPFVEKHYTALPQDEQSAFIRLLEASDPNLFSWLLACQACPDPSLVPVIEKIRHLK